MNARRIWMFLAIAILATQAWSALAQNPNAPARPGTTPRKPPVAMVGTRPIPREELDRRSQQALAEFSRRNNDRELPGEMRDLIRRQVLESLIRLNLLALEAKRTGVTGDPLEAEDVLKKDAFFNPGGRFDESRFLAIKTTQKPAYDAAIASILDQLAARRLNERLESRFRPDSAELRSTAARALTRATVEHLSLRRGDFDGGYPEPREKDVLDWYRAHRAEYQQVDRATLSVAFINSPPLTDAEQRVPGAKEAWTRRMKAVADSLLGVIQKGTNFDKATSGLGPRPGVVVASDNFPGYWQGTAAQNRLLFDVANRGRVLPEPIPALEGWLVVRVDDVVPAHVAALHDVAREIRALLRRDCKLHHDEIDLRNLFARMGDSLAAPGWRIRYAAADTSAMRIAEPSTAELDRWYRGHLADYSSFDSHSGAIVAKPFAQVSGDVRERWFRERRSQQARLLAEQVRAAWSAGRRDAGAEAALGVHEPPPAPTGAALDTTFAGRALSDTLWGLGDPKGTGMVGYRRGWIVWQALGRVERVVPTFEQARPVVEAALQRRRDAEDEIGGRHVFDTEPASFRHGNTIHFTRVTVPPPKALKVPLTRVEVEKHYHDNIDKFSAPELVRARHILVSPVDASPAADAAAREKAVGIQKRLQAGEDFDKLARQYSDDPATKDKGGDLGTFGRGVMLDEFERAAFALQPGDFAPAPVKTEVGYHVIQCMDHEPASIQPLSLVYAGVSADAAMAKATVMAQQRADSIMRVAHTPAQLRALCERLGLSPISYEHGIGETIISTNVRPYFEALEHLKPGEVARPPFFAKGQGYWLTWVDSISAPHAPTWEGSRARAIDEFRRGAGQRALDAKKAEMDSLFASGWSFDSLAALWSGPERVRDLTPGRGLSDVGSGPVLDSLVFGGRRSPGLAIGQASGWVGLPAGWSRLRVSERTVPPAEQVGARLENLRAAETERRLREYFEELKKRWPVKILDPKLREVSLPAPTAAMASP